MQRGADHLAFPILHQIGILADGIELKEIFVDNVEEFVSVCTFRHAAEAYELFETFLSSNKEYTPVVMVHNLGFDMYSLAPWLLAHDTSVLARSATKPITITINNAEGKPALVFWDTLGMFAKNLATMGAECGFPKLVGSWDYDKLRTPETTLTTEEKNYAKRDIYVLFAYIGYYMRLNPMLDESALGRRICTKTGVVRYKREQLFGKLWSSKHQKTVGEMWHSHTQKQRAKTNDELWTMQQATRGGLTFTASRWAGIPLDLVGTDMVVAAYDAASQHPAQMVSHWYPQHFEKATPEILALDMELVKRVTLDDLLAKFEEPFCVAFNACIDVEGLRLKKDSVFEREGIATLANARRGWPNGRLKRKSDYKDSWGVSEESFGKLNTADHARLYLTELDWWILNQTYDYEKATPVHGYETGRFCRPTDYAVLSIMRFYKTKQDFKRFMHTGEITHEVEAVLPDYMRRGEADEKEVRSLYQILKSDLNSVYGIEITNEARPDQKLIPRGGIVQEAEQGVENMPSLSKTWYQFGQRIVGWSRIAQVISIMLINKHCEGVINGDTDSLKVLIKRENRRNVEKSLKKYYDALASAKMATCARVEQSFPNYYDQMNGIGRYELEFETEKFYAAWNKAYMYDACGSAKIVLAGIPTDRGEAGYEALANTLLKVCEWSEVCEQMLGFNVTIGSGITKLNDKVIPEFGTWFDGDINGVHVHEPAVLAICPSPKTIGGTLEPENRRNCSITLDNNADVNIKPTYIDWDEAEGFTIERF